MSKYQKYSRVKRHQFGVTAVDFTQHTVPELLANGKLPLAAMDAPLRVLVPFISQLAVDDAIILNWDDVDVIASRRSITAADLSPDTVYELLLPVANMTAEGIHKLDYTTLEGIGENPAKAELPINITIDRSSPGTSHLGALEFEPGTADGVTAVDLDAQGKLKAIVPNWFQAEAGDKVIAWRAAGRLPPLTDYQQVPTVSVDVPDPNAEVILLFDSTDLPDGWQSFSYKVQDEVGNVNPNLAPGVALNILLGQAPANLLAPVVPAFADDQLITWTDAQPGVDVEITGYDNPLETDVVIVIWGSQEAAPAVVGSVPSPIPTPLLTITVDYEVVAAQGNGPVNVSYRVDRGGINFGPSPVTPVVVDLTTPGGVDPDPETPEHDNLKNLEVRSASGLVNDIPAGDYNSDGHVIIPRAGVDGSVVWVDGDVVQVYWQWAAPDSLLQLPPHTITAQSTDLDLPLLSAGIIDQTPTGTVDVWYTISRPLNAGTPPQFGVALSKKTTVNVSSSADVPGGGTALPLPTFPEANDRNIINKASGADGTPVRVPLTFSNFAAGNTLSLRFVGLFSYTDPTGEEMVPPRGPNTLVEINDQVVTAADIAQGYYDFNLTEENLKVICQGGATALYTADNGVAPASSAKQFVIISVVATDYCRIPVPIPESK